MVNPWFCVLNGIDQYWFIHKEKGHHGKLLIFDMQAAGHLLLNVFSLSVVDANVDYIWLVWLQEVQEIEYRLSILMLLLAAVILRISSPLPDQYWPVCLMDAYVSVPWHCKLFHSHFVCLWLTDCDKLQGVVGNLLHIVSRQFVFIKNMFPVFTYIVCTWSCWNRVS